MPPFVRQALSLSAVYRTAAAACALASLWGCEGGLDSDFFGKGDPYAVYGSGDDDDGPGPTMSADGGFFDDDDDDDDGREPAPPDDEPAVPSTPDAATPVTPDAGTDGSTDSDPPTPEEDSGPPTPEEDSGTPSGPPCGDSLVEFPEQCDDGNELAEDGCNASCQVEMGWVCPSEGGACLQTEADCSSEMGARDDLSNGEHRCSPNGVYRFGLAQDGELTLWRYTEEAWTAGTSGSPLRLTMQGDGNLVVYDSTPSSLWSSKTHGNDGARMVVRDDGSVRVEKDAVVLWQIEAGEAP